MFESWDHDGPSDEDSCLGESGRSAQKGILWIMLVYSNESEPSSSKQ